MKNQPEKKEQKGIRPRVLVILAALMAALVVPIWIATRPLPPAPPPKPVAAAPLPPPPMAQTAPHHPTVTQPRGPHLPASAHRYQAKPVAAPPPPTLEVRWGIQVCGAHLSMGDAIVDVRYKILDPAKVAALGDGKTLGYIIEPNTGNKLLMPKPPKEGAFPPTGNRLAVGKTYFAIVANQGRVLKRGEAVSVILGDARADNVVLE